MKRTLFIITVLFTLNFYGQKAEIENLINQIVVKEVPESFEYYYLVPKSLEQPEIYDSIQIEKKRELRLIGKEFPSSLIYERTGEILDWEKYDLNNVRFVSKKNPSRTSPPTSKTIVYVKYGIDKQQYDSLVDNIEPHNIVVKKKWFWNKKKYWENKKLYQELVKAWKLDEERNLEEKLYLQISKPIFSKDKKFAKITVFKKWRCDGTGFTGLYRNVNGTWKKLVEYNKVRFDVEISHSRCGNISISSYDEKNY
jgi:hypothetical protein